MSFTVTYGGITDKSVGCHAKSRPSVPAPVRRVAVTTIAGRDGSYYDTDDHFEDIRIPITFSFNSNHDRDEWHTIYRQVKAWLLSGDNGDLSFSDDAGFHYRVRNVQITSSARMAWTIGEVTAEFYCDPYTYLDNGDTIIDLPAVVINEYAECHPIYIISGNGTCTLTVNGKEFVVTVGTKAVVDTERMITYRDDSTWANTTVSGDYQDLWLQPGRNTLIKTNGFTVRIKPQWRCI